MLFKSSLLAISALITLAAATVTPLRRNAPPAGTQCCASTSKADEQPAAGVLKGLGIVLQDIDVLVGVSCSPITVIGDVGTCGGTSTAVTCTDNTHGGLVSIGCVPVTLARDVAPVRRNEPPAGTECCGSTGMASEAPFASVLKGLGIDLQGVDVLVALECSPVTVIGGSATCGASTTAVTCTDNSHALISIGCVPVTL